MLPILSPLILIQDSLQETEEDRRRKKQKREKQSASESKTVKRVKGEDVLN